MHGLLRAAWAGGVVVVVVAVMAQSAAGDAQVETLANGTLAAAAADGRATLVYGDLSVPGYGGLLAVIAAQAAALQQLGAGPAPPTTMAPPASLPADAGVYSTVQGDLVLHPAPSGSVVCRGRVVVQDVDLGETVRAVQWLLQDIEDLAASTPRAPSSTPPPAFPADLPPDAADIYANAAGDLVLAAPETRFASPVLVRGVDVLQQLEAHLVLARRAYVTAVQVHAQ